MSEANEKVDSILRLFAERGHRSYGEDVTELQHALQCAALAADSGETPELIAACLLHDYGHLVHDLGEDFSERGLDDVHEERGALLLAQWFPPAVVEPIRLHVAAKRYLCWKDPGYLDGLSAASKLSLERQGGPMDDVDAADFEANPHSKAGVRLRLYDDRGKDPAMQTPALESYRGLLQGLVR